MTNLKNDWDNILAEETQKPYMNQLRDFLNVEYKEQTVYPKKKEIFYALSCTSYSEVRVVILGQDPYHEPGQAHGMAFSVREGVPLPPSLENIFKEVNNSTGAPICKNGDLTRWSRQGVLLLNSVLTVRRGDAGSHRGHGWEQFTDFIISRLNDREEPVIFMLWGADARRKKAMITNFRHIVFEAPHPSPLSAYRGFFGCNHFALANKKLKEMGKEEIKW